MFLIFKASEQNLKVFMLILLHFKANELYHYQIFGMPKNTKSTQQENRDQEQYNSIQYTCKCHKIYKSYPALYTHIKNKHPDDILQYKNWAKKPKDRQIQKGRPKKNRLRPIQAQLQGQLLNIIELGVLQIDECMRTLEHQQDQNLNQKSSLLQGNSTQKFQDLDRKYQQNKKLVMMKLNSLYLQQSHLDSISSELKKRNISELLSQKPIQIFKEQIKFKNELIQHFNSDLSAKIIIQLELIEIQKLLKDAQGLEEINVNLIDQLDIEGRGAQQLSAVGECELNLWANNKDLIKIVRNISQKWQAAITRMWGDTDPHNPENTEQIQQISRQEISYSQYEQQ